MAALRRWWWLPLLGMVLGAGLGLKAGSSSTYTATALVQSRVDGHEAQAVTQGAQSALANLQTPAVFAAAAKARKISAADLTDRTRAAVAGDSSVVTVSVEAPTKAAALADANAVATAAVNIYNDRVQADLNDVRARIVALLKDGQLASLPRGTKDIPNPSSLVNNGQAELSRQSALGQALGDSQASLVTGQGRIRLIEKASEASVTRDVSKAVAAMSALGGLFLGLALALLLGNRRDKIRSVRQVRGLYPGVSAVPVAELDSLLDVDLPGRRRVLVVSDEPTDDAGATSTSSLAGRVRAGLGDAPVQVLTASRDSAVVDRLGRDEETLVLVDVPAGTRVRDLDRVGRTAGPDTVLVVNR